MFNVFAYIYFCMVKNPPANAGDIGGRCGFNPWVGRIPWRRKWPLTPGFLPGKFHGQRRLVDYNPWGHRIRHDLTTEYTHTHIHIYIFLYIYVMYFKAEKPEIKSPTSARSLKKQESSRKTSISALLCQSL